MDRQRGAPPKHKKLRKWQSIHFPPFADGVLGSPRTFVLLLLTRGWAIGDRRGVS